jgi:hypothetical protein
MASSQLTSAKLRAAGILSIAWSFSFAEKREAHSDVRQNGAAMRREEMAAKYYFCVICAGCGRNALVIADPSNGKGRFIGPCVVHVQCSACGAKHEYPNSSVRSVKLDSTNEGD